MRARTAVFILCAAATLGTIVQCGGSSSPPTGNPTPVPTLAPTPTPTPSTGLPAGMVCNPTPPPLYGMILKVHAGDAGRAVLDSKPIVINMDGYCDRVAGTSGKYCETRLEGDLQRVACDYMAVGQAIDTKRWGPTWYFNDQLCDGPNFEKCANHQAEQFLAVAKTAGKFEACAADSVPVWPEGGSRCGVCWFENGDCKK